MGVWLIETEELILIDDTPLTDETFMCLMDGLQKLVESILKTVENPSDLQLAPMGFLPVQLQKVAVVDGVILDRLRNFFISRKIDLRILFVPLFLRTWVISMQRLFIARKNFLGITDAVSQPLRADQFNRLNQGATGIAQQHPVNGEMDLTFHAGRTKISSKRKAVCRLSNSCVPT